LTEKVVEVAIEVHEVKRGNKVCEPLEEVARVKKVGSTTDNERGS
jgi:hypothetical protein